MGKNTSSIQLASKKISKAKASPKPLALKKTPASKALALNKKPFKKAIAMTGSRFKTIPLPQPPQDAPAPGAIRVRIGDNGKVHYHAKDDAGARQQHAASYIDIHKDDFARWKGGGKRTQSVKYTDPATAQSYLRDTDGTFYQYANKTVGPAVHIADPSTLIDRSRADRTKDVLQPFDVGTYAKAVTLDNGKTYHPLPTAHGVWDANNDHIPSGNSLERRDGHEAYQTGFTIAISNSTMHRPGSATYGGRQKSNDGGQHRVLHDVDHPASAFHRDVFHMLDQTKGLQGGILGLDVSQPANRMRQMGAYRTLYRANTRMNETFADRGVDPTDIAEDAVHHPKTVHGQQKLGTFDYTSLAGETQGKRTAAAFRDRLVDENLAAAV